MFSSILAMSNLYLLRLGGLMLLVLLFDVLMPGGYISLLLYGGLVLAMVMIFFRDVSHAWRIGWDRDRDIIVRGGKLEYDIPDEYLRHQRRH